MPYPLLIINTHREQYFAAICADESYSSIKEGLLPVLKEINSILKPPYSSRERCTSTDDNPVSSQGKHITLVVHSKEYQVEFFLGGDYKIRTTTTTKNNSKYINNCVQHFCLLLILGLNQATSIYACVWCNIHKDERYYYMHI